MGPGPHSMTDPVITADLMAAALGDVRALYRETPPAGDAVALAVAIRVVSGIRRDEVEVLFASLVAG